MFQCECVCVSVCVCDVRTGVLPAFIVSSSRMSKAVDADVEETNVHFIAKI